MVRAARNAEIFDTGRSSLMSDGISILCEGSGLTGVSDLSVKLQSGDQRGGTYWVELRLLFSSPSGLSRWLPIPSHSKAQISAPNTLHLPARHPAHQSLGQSHLPGLAVGSSAAAQQRRGLTIAFPCQLQVCQPWACQITVSINSGGGSARKKREMGECGRPRSRESRVGHVGLEEMERM